ncbi:hypothetical protein SAMN04487981_102310 [Streptomyces sp. cf386]|uniref:hypothetical protein n=1 Tax=Streptomyces sp. cf386 TaxID=1761904 RepID=UPI00088409EB|nr:hypothetical protein [Streptomyces sp. cf386]SDM70193.1 hypothetical protein SAMN04487981_102310 [Streptomyces sp. cf386]
MYEKIANPWLPTWIPDAGHALRHAGIHFDAVRMKGAQAERTAAELLLRTHFDAGPIIRELTGERYLYFLLPPQTATAHRWPPGVRTLTRAVGYSAYVGVPALTGVTWPLDWRSVPTEEVPFVEGELLSDVVARCSAGGPRSARPT